MNIIRAAHLGMCFGVRDAIQLALRESQRQPVTILGDLVHNEEVMATLQASGVRTVARLPDVHTPAVMVTAHGASERAMSEARKQGLEVMEATCPLVRLAHVRVRQMVADGCHPVIVGQRNHVEVRGITEDLPAYDVVLTEEDVEALPERAKFGVAAQTTQPIDRVRYLVELIRRRFPNAEVRLADTVCQPTKQRQAAAIALAQACDVVVVIGGARSNNTRELVATCGAFCARVHHVQTAGDLDPNWFNILDTVGVTAGTSTPDWAIDAVEARLREMAGNVTEAQPGLVPPLVVPQQVASSAL